MKYVPRRLQAAIELALAEQSAVGLLGPRQVGKTSLAHRIVADRDAVYLDLENPEDLALLSEPRSLLAGYAGKLVVLDEVQRLPGLFQTLRGLIDQHRRTGRGSVLPAAGLLVTRPAAPGGGVLGWPNRLSGARAVGRRGNWAG